MAVAPNKIPSIFQDPPWLGFGHDGYSVAPLGQYLEVRGKVLPKDFNREYFAIVQSLMSFGLIEAVIDCPVPEDALLRTCEDGHQALCLDPLPEVLTPWVTKARAEGESLTSEKKRVYTSLKAANTGLLRIRDRLRDLRLNYDQAEADNLPAIFCTLGCIGATLERARDCLYPDSNPGDHLPWNLVTALREDHVLGDACALGWCPSDANYVYSIGGPNSARFFFRRPPLQKAGDEDHSECTVGYCVLSKVDVDNYVARHRVEGCNCSYTKPPLDPVVQLINSGTNAVMTLPKDKGSGSRIEVADGSRTPYIAISHVWADGLGSSTEIGLPYCQIFKCSRLAANFNINAFWLDALCVPKCPIVRQKALKLMGRAYREAEFVIVLDNTLQSVSLKSPVKDILASVLTSPWMRRMWTLQEAALAKSIHFQLLDGMLSLRDIDRLVDDVNLQTDDALASMLQMVLRLSVRSWQKMTLCDVAHSLMWRSTSRPSDEIPAIVSLLDVDVDVVLSVPSERRMASMLLNLRTVPLTLPFLAGPKLDHPCFRWAPATFMGNVTFGGAIAMSNLSQTAQVTPEGLVAEYLVCEIEPREFSSGETWSLVDMTSMKTLFDISRMKTYSFADVLGNSGNAGNYLCNFLLFPESSMPSKLIRCLAVLGEEDAVPGSIPGSTEPGIRCTYGRMLAMLGHRPPDYFVDPVVLKHIPSMRKVMIS